MPASNPILLVVYQCIDELNLLLPVENRLSKAEDTVLVGPGGTLDSLGIISLVVALEDALEQATGTRLVLLQEDKLADPAGPYASVGRLVNWIESLLA